MRRPSASFGRLRRFHIAPEIPDEAVESFNRGTAQYIPGGVRQTPGERTPQLLASGGR